MCYRIESYFNRFRFLEIQTGGSENDHAITQRIACRAEGAEIKMSFTDFVVSNRKGHISTGGNFCRCRNNIVATG